LIVVSHRTSTLSGLSRVLALSGGRITADGSPYGSGQAVVSRVFLENASPHKKVR
jgi:ABC-type protease/lipase transport system fused ATPase/permease subunit